MLTSLDLSSNQLCGLDHHGRGTYTAEGITAIADALRVNGGLTVANLLYNELDVESAKMLAEVAKQKGVSLCGIQRDQTTADFSLYEPPDAILLASDLSQAVVTGVLTGINVRDGGIAGDGATQLSAAVLGNIKIEMFNEIPIKEMRADSFTELDLKGKGFGVVGGMVVAGLIPVMGGLTVANLLCNKLDVESAKMLAEVAKQKGVSLCGIQRDQTTADFSHSLYEPPDAIMMASDLSQAVVTGALTELCIDGNYVGDEGVSAVCEAIQSNKETKLASLYFSDNGIGPVGANAVAAMVAVTGALTKLSLAWNELGEEGTKAICEALKQNKTLKELDLSGRDNIGGEAGAEHVADMLGVNGALTKMSLAENKLGEEGTKAICEALKQNKTLKELDLSGSNIGGAAGAKHVADMLGVNGGLTSLDLSNNALCGVTYGGGTYTAEGITAIADALRVNGALTQVLAFCPPLDCLFCYSDH